MPRLGAGESQTFNQPQVARVAVLTESQSPVSLTLHSYWLVGLGHRVRVVSTRRHSSVDGGKNIVVRLHPDIANFLYDEKNNSLENLEREINHRIIIKASQELHHEKYEITEA